MGREPLPRHLFQTFRIVQNAHIKKEKRAFFAEIKLIYCDCREAWYNKNNKIG